MLSKKLKLILLGMFCISKVFANISIEELYNPLSIAEKNKQEISFWQSKIDQNNQPTFQLNLAHHLVQKFVITGDITALKAAENIYDQVLQKPLTNKASVLRSLARVYITQHRFCNALDLVLEASELMDEYKESQLMLFDIYMEIGEVHEASNILNSLYKPNDFQYIIRKAKWEDSQGRLENAINYMKVAEVLAEQSNQKTLKKWIYSNLGDFYGHKGNLNLSQKYFVKALKLDSSDWYSAKGLVWISYSYQKNNENALRMIEYIQSFHQSPDILSLHAEILENVGKNEDAIAFENQAINQMQNPAYEEMYNVPLSICFAERNQMFEALRRIRKEAMDRPTPEVFSVLSYVLYKNEQFEEARRIGRKKVLGKTFEPDALFYQSMVFQEKPEIRAEILRLLQEAAYELGPIKSEKIRV